MLFAVYRLAYHHVHCSGWHDWFQTFDIAHGVVELFCVSLFKATFKNRDNVDYDGKLVQQGKMTQPKII